LRSFSSPTPVSGNWSSGAGCRDANNSNKGSRRGRSPWSPLVATIRSAVPAVTFGQAVSSVALLRPWKPRDSNEVSPGLSDLLDEKQAFLPSKATALYPLYEDPSIVDKYAAVPSGWSSMPVTSPPRDNASSRVFPGSRTFVTAATPFDGDAANHVPPATRSRPPRMLAGATSSALPRAPVPSAGLHHPAGAEGRARNSSLFAAMTSG
jgi:hypothetical protein